MSEEGAKKALYDGLGAEGSPIVMNIELNSEGALSSPSKDGAGANASAGKGKKGKAAGGGKAAASPSKGKPNKK